MSHDGLDLVVGRGGCPDDKVRTGVVNGYISKEEANYKYCNMI